MSTSSNNSRGSNDFSRVEVLVRVRPLFDINQRSCVEVLPPDKIRLPGRFENESVCYRFCKVFGQESKQEDIYDEHIRNILPELYSGHNISIFTYGPTGAGKTHTMLGPQDDPGLIPRVTEELLNRLDSPVRSDCKHSVSMSYLEVYQEKVYDLLEKENKKDLPIREDAKGRIIISGLSSQNLKNYQHFMDLFGPASANRTTAPTKLNSHSSRSHSVLILNITTFDPSRNRTFHGKVSLIDLAGSEDNRRTANHGVRLQESANINTSLLTLRNVVHALNTNQSRIPYRNSKLTRLLQDSLGGSSKSLMFTCVAPEERHWSDTVTSLKFARQTTRIINKPVSKIETPPEKQAADSTTSDVDVFEDNEVAADTIQPPKTQSFTPLLKKLNEKLDERLAGLEQAMMEKLKSEKSADAANVLKEIKLNIKSELGHEITKSQSASVISSKTAIKRKLFTKDSGSSLDEFMALATTAPVLAPDTADDTSLKQKRRRVGKSTAVSKAPSPAAAAVANSLLTAATPRRRQAGRNAQVLELLNAGTLKDIQTLQKVGPKRASQILTYWQLHGSFHAISDIENVPGFTSAFIQTFKKHNMVTE